MTKNNTNVLDYRLIRNSLYINEMNSSQDELQLHRIQNDLNIYDLSLRFTCCFLALHHHPYIQTYILDIRQHTIQNSQNIVQSITLQLIQNNKIVEQNIFEHYNV